MELPEDVMAEILSRVLDLKTLVRFKCVCRQWRRLISSRSFAYLQLKSSVPNPTILVQWRDRFYKDRILHLDPISFAPVERPTLELDSFTTPSFLGSINGLVCLETYFQGPSSVMILNPSTSFFKGIRTKPLQHGVYYRIGFGWDRIADDYKVFRICFGTAEDQFRSLIEVWSANLQYWREYEVNRMIKPWAEVHCNLIMEGFTYCLVEDIQQLTKKHIARFDVKKEVLHLIPIPQLLPMSCSLFLMNWKGCFAVAALVESSCKEYQVWTMDDDRVGSECWSKKFTFEPIGSIPTSINGTQVLLISPQNELILYDLETKDTRKIKSSLEVFVKAAYYHVETLLSIP